MQRRGVDRPVRRAAGPGPEPSDQPQPSPDIGTDASTATLTEASNFAWQEFIALNWPAAQLNGVVQRGQPDTSAKFGQARATPLVWESYRQKVEIFPGANSEAVPRTASMDRAHRRDPTTTADPPQYLYTGGTIPNGGVVDACPGQAPVTQPAWVNLDESSARSVWTRCMPGSSTSRDDTAQHRPAVDPLPGEGEPGGIRLHRRKQAVVHHRRRLHGPDRSMANRSTNGQPPLPGTVITLPAGTVEVKAAWRPLAKEGKIPASST